MKRYLTVLLLFLVIALLAIGVRLYLLNNPQQPSDPHYSETTAVSLETLLNVEEVRLIALTAYKYDTPSELIPLQAKLLDTARQLEMLPEDIEFINSPRLLTYLRFNAAREWFELEVEEAYQNLDDLTPIKEKYPEAKDLFVSADALFAKRDYILQEIATEIATLQKQTENESHMEAAKAIWLARTNKDNPNP